MIIKLSFVYIFFEKINPNMKETTSPKSTKNYLVTMNFIVCINSPWVVFK